MKAFQMKYNKEFRKDYPETVGETDHDFDTHNYVEWLEEYTAKLISDHKAVVESKDKEIQYLETTLNFRDESIVKMQNKIDELEKVCKNILFVDMDLIDQLSDMQKVHRFTKMRESLEALFPVAKGIK